MVSRNKHINSLIGNLANSIVHRSLANATEDSNLSTCYEHEAKTSLKQAEKVRNMINPRTTYCQSKTHQLLSQKSTGKSMQNSGKENLEDMKISCMTTFTKLRIKC